MADRVIGIDLGTTHCCVALVEEGQARVLADRAGRLMVPARVAIAESGRRLVGHVAERQAVVNAAHTAGGLKRLIGRRWDAPAVRQHRAASGARLVEGPLGDVRVLLRGQRWSLPELCALLLEELKGIAEAHAGVAVDKAVIAVPAQFTDGQRQAVKDAGRLAGLDVVRILHAPTAAALAYGFGRHDRRKVAVFDLGGGTFDVSVLAIGAGACEVLGTAGDAFLGGDDFDRRVVDWLADGFADDHGLDLRADRMALQRLTDVARKAVRELSQVEEAEIALPFIASRDGEELHLERRLGRDKLEELTGDLVDRCVATCQRMLADAGVAPGEIEDVLLVGGMTRMPRVVRAAAELFGREPAQSIAPEEVIALGAAIQGAALAGDAGEALLYDVTPRSLGIMIQGGYFHRLIQQNTTVPTQASHIFTTVKDNQTSVKILVLQGESDRAEENELLGEFILTGLRRAARGEVEIEVTFEISADGIVSVSAHDLETGQKQAITVTATSGLTEEEIRRLVAESHDELPEERTEVQIDRRREAAKELILEIERLFPRVESAVAESERGADAMREARAVIERARERLAGSDLDLLGDSTEALTRTLNVFRGVVKKTSVG